MISHKTNHSKLKKFEIIATIFFDPNGMKLEISNKRKVRIYINIWKLSNTLLNSHCLKE